MAMPEMPVCALWEALIRQPEFVAATLMIPSPRIDRVRASKVPTLEEYVLPTANAEPDWFVCAAVVTPLIVTVPPEALVDCDSVIPFVPANTSLEPVIPVSPLVLPTFDTPPEKPPPAPAEIVIV